MSDGMKQWAPSPYTVECMGLEMFQQAQWLAVYGASIAAQAQLRKDMTGVSPGQSDVTRYVEEAAALANMVAKANGSPER
jgi:hypothetical protein